MTQLHEICPFNKEVMIHKFESITQASSLYVGMRGIFQDGGRFGKFQTPISLLSYFLWPYNWLS